MEAKDWQVGDVVRCVDLAGLPRLVIGHEYTISNIAGFLYFEELPSTFAVYPYSFEFVRRPSFTQVTDQFICIDCNMNHSAQSMSTKRHLSCHSCARKFEDVFQPKIELKPVCACCTKATFPEPTGDIVRHEDPCQYTHDERYMLPGVKQLFRANQARRVANTERYKRGKEELELLGRVEKAVKEMRDGGCAPYTPALYRELTENDK